MRTRQVVQRARPPQTEACGRPASRTASRMLRPIGATITRPEACRSFQTHAPACLLVLRQPEHRTGRQDARGRGHAAILARFGLLSSNPVRDEVQRTTHPLLVRFVGMRLIRAVRSR